jgi:hypothetical protein
VRNSRAVEHEESSLPLIIWIVPTLAAIAIPGLVWAVGGRPVALRFELAYAMTFGVAVVATIVFAILSRGFRYRIRWALSTTAIATLACFQWPGLTSAGNAVATTIPVPFLAAVVPVAVVVAILWLAARNGGDWQFATITGTALLAAVVGLIASAIPLAELASPAMRNAASAHGAPDVLLLVLDGYTRSDILDEHFGFDNTSFHRDLEALGFTVAEQARANYNYTRASLAAMLSLDYVYQPGPIGENDDQEMRNALSGNPAMLDRFRLAGYEVAYTENAWQGSHCGAAVDICHRRGLTERVVWNLGQMSMFAPVLSATRPHPFNSVSLQHLDALSEMVLDRRTEGVPRLTVAHLILPHPPFLLDDGCVGLDTTPVRRAFETPSEKLITDRQALYTDQLVCTNGMVLGTIEEVVAARPNTIIMITGDHGSDIARLSSWGSDDWTDASIEERMSIFSAYRFPDCGYEPYPTMTPVNGTRLTTNCALGSDLGLIADMSMWAPNDGDGIKTHIQLDGSTNL